MLRNVALVLTLMVATLASAVNSAAGQFSVDEHVVFLDNDVGDQPETLSLENDLYVSVDLLVLVLFAHGNGVLTQKAEVNSAYIDLKKLWTPPVVPTLSTSYGACGDICPGWRA